MAGLRHGKLRLGPLHGVGPVLATGGVGEPSDGALNRRAQTLATSGGAPPIVTS
jgi:hypothetical protein